MGSLIPPHPLTNFEIQTYYENEPRFNGVCSRKNLPEKIKDGYIMDIYLYNKPWWICRCWYALDFFILLFCNRNKSVYFNSFDVEYIPEEIEIFIENKNIKVNIFRV